MTEREKNRIIFEELPIPRAVATMALPTVVAQLLILIYNMADTFFLGRANNPYMVAGASLILPIYNLTIALACISGTGGGTLISRLLGAGKPENSARVSAFSIWFSVSVAGFFAIGTAMCMHPLLTLLGASDATYNYARQYTFCVIVLGGIPTILSMTLGNLLRSTGCAKQSGFGASMGAVINIILDPLFMFVLLPRGNETMGAGLATCISNAISCLYFLVVIYRRRKETVLRFSPRIGLPDREELRSIFSVGIPAAMGTLLFDLDYVVIDKLMSQYSDTALAAIGIVLKAERLPLNIGIGLCLGMTPIAGYNFSAGNLARMKESVVFTRRVGVTVSVVSIALYEFFAPQILRFFIADPGTVMLGTQFLRIRALATILMFLCFIYVHMFNAVGKGSKALFLVVFRWAVCNIPMLLLLNALFGMYGVAWSQLTADSIVAAVSFLVYERYRRTVLEKD